MKTIEVTDECLVLLEELRSEVACDSPDATYSDVILGSDRAFGDLVRGLDERKRRIAKLESLLKQSHGIIRDQAEHLDKFCKCPSHGPSLIQIPEGD